MNELDREIGLALLKCLYRRKLISEKTFLAACGSRSFDRNRFTPYGKTDKTDSAGEGSTLNDDPKTERGTAERENHL